MNPLLNSNLQQYRKSLNFNAKSWVDSKVKSLINYMTDSKLQGCVVGLSGGIDSAVTFCLAVKAMRTKNSPIKVVVPVLMPMDSHNSVTYKRALDMCNSMGITPFYDSIGLQAVRMRESSGMQFSSWMHNEMDKKIDWKCSDFAYGQLQSYLRTPHLYFVTQLLNNQNIPSIVLGTGNADEDHYLGYFCKAGDGVVDVQLINDLHKNQVYTVGKHIGVISDILKAVPTADLWEGQSDEDELGVTYDFVELYTGYYLNMNENSQQYFIKSLDNTALQEFRHSETICQKIHNQNKHKLTGVINL
jgi:NAD+ synthase (glutamine-hydrolysing)